MSSNSPVYRCKACDLLSGGKPSDDSVDGKMKAHRCKTVNVKIQFKESSFTEIYDTKVSTGSSIAQLKGDLELLTGIPSLLQEVCFNDEAKLNNNAYLHELNLVSNCTLSLAVRHDWAKLVEAVLQQDFKKLLTLGITENSDFRSPSIDYLKDANSRKEALRFRGTVALIIACHRGMARLVHQMIAAGINVNGQTQFKRTALHIVAAKGQSEILDILIHNGANVDLVDYNNETALDIANRLEQQQSARQLFLFRWQQRAKNAQPSFADIPMFPHQYYDSDLTVHFNGNQGQVYMMHVPPPGETDRWKPRKNVEVIKTLKPSPPKFAPPNDASSNFAASSKVPPALSPPSAKERSMSMSAEFVRNPSFTASKKSRPQSPSFAYASGIAPEGKKIEGKKSFEEWLEQKMLAEKHSRRNQLAATAVSTQDRLINTHRECQPHIVEPSLSSRIAKSSQLGRKASESPSVRSSKMNTRYASPLKYVGSQEPSSRPPFKLLKSSDNLEFAQESSKRPLSRITKAPPIHNLVYHYVRVNSASDRWVKLDRPKSGIALTWS